MRQTQGLKRTTHGVQARRAARTLRRALLGFGLGLGAQTLAWAQAAAPLAAASSPTPTPSPRSAPTPVSAAKPPAAPASVPTIEEPPQPAVENSYLDGPLLYQLLLAEFALRENEPGDAVELLLEAARRNKDDALFRRALQIAVEAGAGDKALAISKSWRQAVPKSTEAVRTQVQILIQLDRIPETAEPLRQLLSLSTPPERTALIMSLPRAAQQSRDKAGTVSQFRQLLQPYADVPETRTAARVALARLQLLEGKAGAALDLATAAQAEDPSALPPVLLALDILNASSDGSPRATDAGASTLPPPIGPEDGARAETIVRTYLAQPDAEPLVRQTYAGVLANQQRLPEAAQQLRTATRMRPDQAQLWLALGEIELELRRPEEATATLENALSLVTEQQAALVARQAAAALLADNEDDDDGSGNAPPDAPNGTIRLAHVQLLLARAAEQRHDDVAEARWLSRIDDKDVDLQVIALRASLLARQGKLAEARALVRAAPAATPADERFKLLSEVQLLLDADKLDDARKLLVDANAQAPDDVDLIYQEAMIDERTNRLDEMEKLLRRILALQPNNSQALNALGYSLADRNLRLDEALTLVKQAHDLAPADPFIADSLGWVLYRMGQYGEATALLNQAYASRKDTEIAAHLGEVLWADGKHDEATQVLRDARRRDEGNDVLKQTMARLKVAP